MSRAAAFFVRDLRLALAYPLDFWMQWVGVATAVLTAWGVSRLVPPSVALGFGGAHGSYFGYVVINMAFFTVMATAMGCFQRAIRGDQMLGTLEAMLVTPTRLATVVLATSLWPFAQTLLRVACYVGLGALLFGLQIGHADVPAVLLFLLLIVASSAPIGVLSAAAIVRYKQVAPSDFLVGGAASLLGGVMFPVALLPGPLRDISWMLPVTHGLNGMRAAIAGATLPQLRGDATWLLAASAILMPIALVVFKRSVEAARRDGTLGHY